MNVGGPALQVSALTEGLDADRFEQRLLVGDVGPEEGDYLELRAPHIKAVRVRGLGRAPNVLADARALAQLRTEMRAFRPHIVHTHTAKAGALGRVAARVTRTPAVVHTFHGHLLHGYFSPGMTKVVVMAERTLARLSHRLVAVGSRVRDELIAAGIGQAEQYAVIPPGVEPSPIERAEARGRLGLAPDVPVVAFVGRLTQVKRPDRFIDTALRVASEVGEAQFVVAGGGQLLEDMRRRAAPLGERIHFLGWRGDIETIYGAADVVVLCSDNEGMPVSLIEAAAHGCPAVTSDVGSAAEVVVDGETGYVTSPEVAALSHQVTRIVTDPELRVRLGAAATEHARRVFGRQRLIDDYAALYEALALERGIA